MSWGRHQGEGGERPRPRLETDVVRNPTKLRRNQAPESYLLRTEAGDYSNILQPLTFPSSILSAEFPQNSRLLKWFQLHHGLSVPNILPVAVSRAVILQT